MSVGIVDDLGMFGVTVTRWRRYGKDRLYVKDAEGTELGWVDLLTGERTMKNPEYNDQFNAAVNLWYVESAGGSVTDISTMPAYVEPQTQPAPLPWHDLASHVPGQAAREQSLREYAAMRERTRVGTFVARALDVKTEERAWRIGASGEQTVGAG